MSYYFHKQKSVEPGPGQGTDFADLVKFVIQRTPPIHIPWLDLKDLPPKDLAQILSRKAFKGHNKQEQQGAKTEERTEVKREPLPESSNSTLEGRYGIAMAVDEQIGIVRCVQQKERTECDSDVPTSKETVQGPLETKKRMLQDMSVSHGERKEEHKKTKVSKIPYRPTNVKQVKIISKLLKGKKKKKEKK